MGTIVNRNIWFLNSLQKIMFMNLLRQILIICSFA